MTKEEFIKESKNGTLSRLFMRDVNTLCGIETLEDVKNLSAEERANFSTRRTEAIEAVKAEIEKIRAEIQAEKERLTKPTEENESAESETV